MRIPGDFLFTTTALSEVIIMFGGNIKRTMTVCRRVFSGDSRPPIKVIAFHWLGYLVCMLAHCPPFRTPFAHRGQG